MSFQRFHTIPNRTLAKANDTIDQDPFYVHWRIYRLCHTEKNTNEVDCLTLPRDVESAADYLIKQIQTLNQGVQCGKNGVVWVPLWVKYTALATLASTMLRWCDEFPIDTSGASALRVRKNRNRLVWRNDHSGQGDFPSNVNPVVDDTQFKNIVDATESVIRRMITSPRSNDVSAAVDLYKETYRWLQGRGKDDLTKIKNMSCPTNLNLQADSKNKSYLEGRFIVVFAAIVCLLARSKLEREGLRGEEGKAAKKKALADKTNATLVRYYAQLRFAAGAQPYDSYIHIEDFFPQDVHGDFMHAPWKQLHMHQWMAQLGAYVVKLNKDLVRGKISEDCQNGAIPAERYNSAIASEVFNYPAVRLFSKLHLRHRERQFAFAKNMHAVPDYADTVIPKAATARRMAIETTIESLESSGRLCAAAALGAHYCHIASEYPPKSPGAQTAIAAYLAKFARMAHRCGYVVPADVVRMAEDQPACEVLEEPPFGVLCTTLLDTQDIRALIIQIDGILDADADEETIAAKRQHIQSADFVDRLALLLTDAFDLPFHADESLRIEWQKTVLKLMASFELDRLHALPADTLLRLHAIAAHVGATAQRGLEWHERQMIAAVDSVIPSVVARRRAVTAASESEVVATLSKYASRRNYGKTDGAAYLQVLLLSDAVIQVFACGLRDGELATSLHRVTFRATTSGEYASMKNWSAAVEAFAPILPSTTTVYKPTETVLGTHQSFIELKQEMTKAATCVAGDNVGDLLISPDPKIAKIPWQYFFTDVNGSDTASLKFLVCHVPSIKWLHSALTEHYSVIARGWMTRHHQRGVSGWMANMGTPSIENDLRRDVAKHFGADGVNLRRPTAYENTSGLSLSYVFAHGRIDDKGVVRSEAMDTDETKAEQEWDAVADRRIVLLLSCHTGHGTEGKLRDYVGLPTRLLVRAKAMIAPPYEVPSDVAVTLATHVGACIRNAVTADNSRSIPVGRSYIDAIGKDWRVSLFSLWGMSSEFIRWQPSGHRPENG